MKYVIAIVVLASVVGCKQGEGGRCQVNADCKEPLTCNIATQLCQGNSAIPFDADTIDASPDAPTDAAGDAPHDAPHD